MRVLHIIPGISRDTGGPSRSSQGLVSSLCAAGVDAWFHSYSGDAPWMPGVRALKPVGAQLTDDDLRAFDLIHLHAIWSWEQHRVAAQCRRLGIPYVIAPRGMLEPWSLRQGWLKKRVARFLYQDRDLKGAAALHATAASEAEQFRKLGFANACIVSPNGVSLPEGKVEKVGGGGRRRALFVSRMHPKKGVLELVEAWSRIKLEGRVGDWKVELVYTMNSDEERAYEQKVKARILALGMSYQDKDGNIHSTTTTSNCNFILTGELDDEAKWQAYARADLFVLPTYSENFGIVVAEALWAGVPVVTTKGTPWRELETVGCGWWIDTGVDALADCLGMVLGTSPSTLVEKGARGHALVAEKYTWPGVSQALIRGYKEILHAH